LGRIIDKPNEAKLKLDEALSYLGEIEESIHEDELSEEAGS